MSIVVTVEFPLHPDKAFDFSNLMKNALTETLSYPGCLGIETYLSEDSSCMLAIENWESKNHQENYFKWRIDTGLIEAIGPFLSSAPTIKYFKAN